METVQVQLIIGTTLVLIKQLHFRDVDKSPVAGNLLGCESTFTRLIK